MSLSDKTDQEIIQLLNEYGIKHGPIVDSTRGLYEKKLKDAMEEDPTWLPPGAAAGDQDTTDAMDQDTTPLNPSSDKTYYREEEEVIILHHHLPSLPVTSEGCDLSRRNVGINEVEEEINDDDNEVEEEVEEEINDDTEPQVQSSAASYDSAAPSKEPILEPAGWMSLVWRLLLIAVVAGLLYVLYCNMEEPVDLFGLGGEKELLEGEKELLEGEKEL